MAYVGADAPDFLPKDVRGLRLYCWPQAAVTNPWALEDLQKQCGVDVRLVDRLHMKIYWSERGGAVIGSANLSDNALGDDGLAEAAIHLPAGPNLTADISAIEKCFGSAWRTLSDRELKRLKAAGRKGRKWTSTPGPTRAACKFSEWYADGSAREDWYVGWRWFGEADGDVSTFPANLSQLDHLGTCNRSDLDAPGAYVLDCQIGETAGRIKLNVPKNGWWRLADAYHKTANTAHFGKYVHIRFAEPGRVKHPPFVVDQAFKKALRAAIEDVVKASRASGFEAYFTKHGLRAGPALVESIMTHYRRLERA